MLEQYWLTAVEAHPGYQIFLTPPFDIVAAPTPPHDSLLPLKATYHQSPILAAPESPKTGQADSTDSSSLANGRPSKRSKGDSS